MKSGAPGRVLLDATLMTHCASASTTAWSASPEKTAPGSCSSLATASPALVLLSCREFTAACSSLMHVSTGTASCSWLDGVTSLRLVRTAWAIV